MTLKMELFFGGNLRRMMMSSKWINFKQPAFIGVDYDCKGNPLIDWKDKLKLQSDDDTIGYDFKVVAYRKVKVSDE